MTLSRFTRALLAGALLAPTACESGTDPEPQRPIDLVLDFCSDEIPIWIAYRNEGADWVRLAPDANGAVSFTASNDVALALVRQNGGDYATDILFAANTELEAISGQSCLEESGSKTVHGTVSGVVGSQIAHVGMSYSSVPLQAHQTSFSLQNVPERPLDVVAARYNVAGTTLSADRIVIRRSQVPVTGAAMAPIDFAAASALVPVAFTATISGIGAQDGAILQNYFVSQLRTERLLTNVETATNGNFTLFGVPQPALAVGDYHTAFALAVDPTGLVRGVERFFLAPATQTFALGTPLSASTLTEAATSPSLRYRIRQPRNGDYARAMRVDFSQQQLFASTLVSMTVTQGYDGNGDWDVTIPDFSAVSGWQNGWGLLDSGGEVEWTISAFGARPELLFGAPPADGETVRFASRSSSANVAVGASRRAVSARFPRPVVRLR